MVQDGNETGKGTRDWIGLDGLVCKRLQFGLCGGLVGVVMDNDKAVLGAEGEFAAVDFGLGAAGLALGDSCCDALGDDGKTEPGPCFGGGPALDGVRSAYLMAVLFDEDLFHRNGRLFGRKATE